MYKSNVYKCYYMFNKFFRRIGGKETGERETGKSCESLCFLGDTLCNNTQGLIKIFMNRICYCKHRGD